MSEPGIIVAGVDGGATHTRAMLAGQDGTVLGTGTAGPSNYDNVGTKVAADNIRGAVLAARKNAGITGQPLAAIFLGMAGVVSADDRDIITTMVTDNNLAPRSAVHVDHDIRIAHAGGLQGGEGVVLIAGTGSSTYGRTLDGRHHRTGWGYLLDDRGSGYFLGLQAIIATVMEADGRGAPTRLSATVQSHLGYSAVDDILRIMYHPALPVARIAALAPEVISAGTEGDSVALNILATGARELARMVETVARALAFTARPFPVTMVGGLVDHPGLYRRMTIEALHDLLRNAVIVEPALPPVAGAVLLALEAAGVPPTREVLEHVRSAV
jgi:N-acetylglucosamine kinase-like BadF-type ATPase